MSALKERLFADRPSFGPLVTSGAPFVVEIFGALGFDWVILDTEHSHTSGTGQDLETMIRAAEAARLPAMVRVAANLPHLLMKAMNVGAEAVWVPHIESAEAAHAAAQALRFTPAGLRGAAPIVRAAKYGLTDWESYRVTADRDACLVAIIESRLGVEHVEEIAAVPGVDVLCCGLFDLAVDLGIPSARHYGPNRPRWVDETLEAAADRVLAAARAHGKAAATVAWDVESAERWIERGFRVILFGLDVAMFAEAARSLRHKIGQVAGERLEP